MFSLCLIHATASHRRAIGKASTNKKAANLASRSEHTRLNEVVMHISSGQDRVAYIHSDLEKQAVAGTMYTSTLIIF